MVICSFANFRYHKSMYENLSDKEAIIKCNNQLNHDGKWDAMETNPFSVSDG